MATKVYPEKNLMYHEPSSLKRWGLFIICAVGAFVLTMATTYCMGLLGDTYISNIILKRGRIPHLEVFFFWLAAICLLGKLATRRMEKKLFNKTRKKWIDVRSNINPSSLTIPAKKSGMLLKLTDDMPSELLMSKTGNRLHCAVRRFHKTKSSKEVDDVLNTLSDMDSNASESAYSNLRYFVWLIPTLGFIGTVLGIGRGISGFSKIIEASSSFENVRIQISPITQDLGIAFDTTLLALFLTAIILSIMSYFQKRDEDLLYQIDAFCVEEVTGSFEETDEQTEAIKGLAGRIGEHITQQTKELAKYFDNAIQPVDLSKLQKSVVNIEKRFYSLISKESEKIEKAIRDSSNIGEIQQTSKDLKKTVSESVARIEKSFGELQEGLTTTAKDLKYVAKTLGKYVEESGVSNAAEFTKAVNELKNNLKPITQAVSELSGASKKLDGLSSLASVADNLKEATIGIEKAAKDTQKGGEGIKAAGTNLTEIIAGNKVVLEGVKTVLTDTTSSIKELRNTIIGMNQVLSGISTTILGVQQNIQIVVDEMKRRTDNE